MHPVFLVECVYVKKECKVVRGCGVSEEPGRPAEGIQLRDRLYPYGMWRWRFVSFRVQLWHEAGHPCRLDSIEFSFCFQAEGVRSVTAAIKRVVIIPPKHWEGR